MNTMTTIAYCQTNKCVHGAWARVIKTNRIVCIHCAQLFHKNELEILT